MMRTITVEIEIETDAPPELVEGVLRNFLDRNSFFFEKMPIPVRVAAEKSVEVKSVRVGVK